MVLLLGGSSQNESRTITLRVEGQALIVVPACPDVETKLITRSLDVAHDDQHGSRIVRRPSSLLNPALVGPTAGLASIAQYLAAQSDYKVTLQLPVRRLGPCVPLAAREPTDHHLLEFVGGNSHGVIRYAPGRVTVAWLVAQIALAYPEATVAVVTASEVQACRFLQRLWRWIPTATLATARTCPEFPGRVMVSTFYGLAHPTLELERRQIVIALDAEEAAGERGQLALYCAKNARLFGLLPIGYQPAPRNWDRVVAAFGLEQTEVPRHGDHVRQVRVAMVKIFGGIPLPMGNDALSLLKHGIWHHSVRNRQLAGVANALANGDQLKLLVTCPAANQANLEPRRTIVLTDTVEHALALAVQLPTWPLFSDDEEINQANLTPQKRELMAERLLLTREGIHAIATVGGLANLDLNQVDAVVWAGGRQHLPPLPADKLISGPGQEQPLLVVDCADRHHPRLRQWSRRRQEAYIASGWFPVGANPSVGRIANFLAQRGVT
jgi:hypothetical protein